MVLNFQGGAEINASRRFASAEIKDIDSCSAVCIKTGSGAIPELPDGAEIKKGTLLGFSDETPVYSPICGRFNGITEIEGEEYFVVIGDGRNEEERYFDPETRALTDMSRDDIIFSARQYAVSDARSGKYLWKLLDRAAGCKRLIVDCTEPFAHSAINYRLCIEKAKELVFGAKVILHAAGASKCVFACEASKKDIISALSKYACDEKLFATALMEEKYPCGDGALMQGIYLKTLARGEFPADKGVLIVGAEAAIALYEAMSSGMPQLFRYVTLCGDRVNGGNFKIPRGMTLHDLKAFCGPTPENELLIENTLLSGKEAHGVIGGGVSALISAGAKKKDKAECISCGECVRACPVGLFPFEILSGSRRYLRERCISCGACEYVCPAGIPLLGLIQGKENGKNE